MTRLQKWFRNQMRDAYDRVNIPTNVRHTIRRRKSGAVVVRDFYGGIYRANWRKIRQTMREGDAMEKGGAK